MSSSYHFTNLPKIPTQIKHIVLEKYLAAWAGIICQTNRNANLAFVDTCAGPGSYLDIRGRSDIKGSPLIALKTLSQVRSDPRFMSKTINTKSLFIEKDSYYITSLRHLLEQGDTFNEPYDIRESDFTLIVDEVLEFTKDSFGFIFIDPFGPSSIPFSAITKVVSQKFNDVLINFPVYSIQKWAGFIQDYDKDALAKQRVDYVTSCFGGTDWIDTYLENPIIGRYEKEWLNLYLNKLEDLGVYTTSAPILFEHQERNIYHLIFTSRNLAGLIAMKDTMLKGKDEEAIRRTKLKARAKHPQQSSFFDINGEWLSQIISKRPDSRELANEIGATMGLGTYTRKNVYERFIPKTPYLKSDIDKALTLMKRQGRVIYEGTIKFDQIIRLK